jgi:cellulose biosynthesis protein BcsQ
MPTVVFANRKGGVGKTLSTLYTGRWLARAGRDVTLVDLDPQKSLWDIAALLGRSDGVFTRRLRIAPDSGIPATDGARSWTLVDTPPALDGSLPALQRSDYIVVPVIPEAQEVAQLEKFLTMLEETRQDRPCARVVGILPVRYVRYWAGHRACLAAVEQLAEAFGHPVLEPVPTSQAVIRYSMQGGLWRHVAAMLMALEPKAAELGRAA